MVCLHHCPNPTHQSKLRRKKLLLGGGRGDCSLFSELHAQKWNTEHAAIRKLPWRVGCSSGRASCCSHQGCCTRDSLPSWDTVLLHFPSCFCSPAAARCRWRWRWCYLLAACAASTGPALCSPAFWRRTAGALPSCSQKGTEKAIRSTWHYKWKMDSLHATALVIYSYISRAEIAWFRNTRGNINWNVSFFLTKYHFRISLL